MKYIFPIITIYKACNLSSNKQDIKDNILKKIMILAYPKEVNLQNIKQLTFSGDNAEAYFSFDDSMLVFQLIILIGM